MITTSRPDPEPHLARAVDSAPLPGREPLTLVDKLRDLGVPESSLRPLVALILTEGMKAAATHMLQVRLRLGNTPSARALDRAMFGDDGETLAEARAVVRLGR